ncbi:MAG: LPS export ABC transporter periplasmic protein LptC [Chitinophagaceae bacterium]|nr:MAG: LPS export ABC transporter periplasmic protein LptC [Chitinophagaceae bacterium]
MQGGSRNANTIKMRLPAVVILILCAVLAGCENDPGKVKNLTSKKLGVEEGKDITLNYTLGGNIKTVLTAPVMLRVQEADSYIEFPNTLKAIFYNEEGVAESKLTARYGKYRENEEIVFLRDSVVVINFQKGDTLYSDEMYWDRSRTGTEFYTNKPVKIRTKTQHIDGVGMEASQDFRNHHVLEVTGIIAVPSSKFPG